MAYNRAQPILRLESPTEFFKNIRIPPNWRYIGRNDIIKGSEWDSFGFVYQTSENTIVRLCAFAGKGGMVQKNTETGIYDCLMGNHSSEEINQFLSEQYGIQ